MSDHRVIFGDALDVLRGMEAGSVDCCATSPPYFGLRDYGVAGQIGLEEHPEEYIRNLVRVFDAVWRVLKPTGTLWLNLGDSYAASRGGTHQPAETLAGGVGGYTDDGGRVNRGRCDGYNPTRNAAAIGLKHKDMIGIPWRVALELQSYGWWLRNDVIWAKPNPMPESVTDRFSSTHEHVFLLTKAARYWFDLDAVRAPMLEHSEVAYPNGPGGEAWQKGVPGQTPQRGLGDAVCHPLGKNPGDVWRIATQPTPYAHFATWPEALVERMILAGCPPKVCRECGVPWEHRVDVIARRPRASGGPSPKKVAVQDGGHSAGMADNLEPVRADLGYHPACRCQEHSARSQPGLVLDPFCGSGTTLQVARKLGRRSIGIELNPDYEAVMRQRLGCPHGALFEDVRFE